MDYNLACLIKASGCCDRGPFVGLIVASCRPRAACIRQDYQHQVTDAGHVSSLLNMHTHSAFSSITDATGT